LLDNEHERSNPEMSIHQKVIWWSATNEALYHTWHQVANDDEVTDPDSKTFDRDSSVKNNGRIGVRELR
jgi:hypothetical protein